MDWKTTVLLAAAALSLLVVFLGRYELVAVSVGGEGAHGIAYRLDRRTDEGNIHAGREWWASQNKVTVICEKQRSKSWMS